MPFRYYQKLSPMKKEIYRRSDSITSVNLNGAERLSGIIKSIEEYLQKEDQFSLQNKCQELAISLSKMLGVPGIKIKILSIRPSSSCRELHGLYYPKRGDIPAMIILWMRTAKKAKPVTFKTFLRTFIHEFCHHLDYELFKLPESFHTEGFYKRESSILHQLLN
ncbi:MAG: hypothetical protein N2257_08270 [Thermodesulfovibrionales bacterium]|nr:hypothetical protein [Thermodesulfovibrionales bacterium]